MTERRKPKPKPEPETMTLDVEVTREDIDDAIRFGRTGAQMLQRAVERALRKKEMN
jgi:hypothetical protein